MNNSSISVTTHLITCNEDSLSRPHNHLQKVDTSSSRATLSNNITAKPTAHFEVKPYESAAKQYEEQGSHYWKIDLFTIKAPGWLKALKKLQFDICPTSTSNYETQKHNTQLRSHCESTHCIMIEHHPSNGFTIKVIRHESDSNNLKIKDAAYLITQEKTNIKKGYAMHHNIKGLRDINTPSLFE